MVVGVVTPVEATTMKRAEYKNGTRREESISSVGVGSCYGAIGKSGGASEVFPILSNSVSYAGDWFKDASENWCCSRVSSGHFS